MNVNDNINLEYEARVMITENQYSLVKDFYLKTNLERHQLVNINYYYDDDKLTITNNSHVLRLRTIDDNKYELTLKIKGENGDIEINKPLTSFEIRDIQNQVNVSDEDIIKQLKSINVDLANLKLIAKLKTERIEVVLINSLLVIDKNYYSDKIDFNLEVESISKSDAVALLKEICEQFDIEYKKDYISKSRRAIYNL